MSNSNNSSDVNRKKNIYHKSISFVPELSFLINCFECADAFLYFKILTQNQKSNTKLEISRCYH